MIAQRNPDAPPADVTIAHLETLWRSQGGTCALSGVPMTHTGRPHDPHGRNVSLDRIDSRINYSVGNVQLVCQDLNRMKHSLSEEAFAEYCQAVVQHKRPRARRASF